MLTISDYSDIRELSAVMIKAANKLESLVRPVSIARQIKDFSPERKKRALAVCCAAFEADGLSATACETKARGCESYKVEMARLGEELRMAEQTILEYDVAKTAWESCRSLVSIQKAIAGNL